MHVFHALNFLYVSIMLQYIYKSTVLYIKYTAIFLKCTPEYMLTYAYVREVSRRPLHKLVRSPSGAMMRFPPCHAAPELLCVGVDSDRFGRVEYDGMGVGDLLMMSLFVSHQG